MRIVKVILAVRGNTFSKLSRLCLALRDAVLKLGGLPPVSPLPVAALPGGLRVHDVIINSAQPTVLYKYREDSPRTEEIFSSGKIWLSVAADLNDPLECETGQIPSNWKEEEIQKMQKAQMSGFLMSAIPSLEHKQPFHSYSYPEIKQWADRFKQMETHQERYAATRQLMQDFGFEGFFSKPEELFDTFEQQLATVGVFSLSESLESQLMWAHYAKSHTGLAIGFNREAENKLGSSRQTLAVTYENAKPVFEDGFINQITYRGDSGGGIQSQQMIGFEDATFRAAFSRKPVDWSYEKEWRYVEQTSGLFPWPGAIVRVVFGLRMPPDRRKRYSELVSASVPNPVTFFEFVKSTAGYGFSCAQIDR